MPSIIQWWRDRYPEKSAGLSDEQIAIAIIQSDPHASISHPELKQYEPSAKRFDERKNGAPFDSQTAKDFSYLKDRPKEERGPFSTYFDNPVKRGVLMSKQADLIMSSLGPKKEFTREDAAKLVQIRKEMEELEVSPHYKEFQEATGFVDSWGELWGWRETPAIAVEVATESLAAMLHHGWKKVAVGAAGGAGTALALGQAGPQVGLPEEIITVPTAALWGASTASGKTSYNLTASSKFLEVIEATVGRDVMDDPQALYDVINDPDKMKQARSKASLKGLPVGLFDAMSMGLAGRFASMAGRLSTAAGSKATAIGARTSAKIPKTGLLDEAARLSLLGTEKAAPFLAPTVIQGLMGSSGEAFGQLASEGKIDDWKSVFLEGIAEFGMAPFDLTVGHLTKDMTPEHAKALNDRINDFRKSGFTSDQQKAQVDADIKSGILTAGQGDVYKSHIDEVYEVKNKDEKAVPSSEEGAVTRVGEKEALKALNSIIAKASPTVRASQREEAGGYNILIGSDEAVSKFGKASKEERGDLLSRDIKDGGVSIESSVGFDWRSSTKKGLSTKIIDTDIAFEIGEGKLKDAETAGFEGVKGWDNLKDEKSFEGHGDRAGLIISALGNVDADYDTRSATAEAVISDFEDKLSKKQQESVRKIGSALDYNTQGEQLGDTPTSSNVPFTKKGAEDPNQFDLFNAVEAEEQGVAKPKPTKGSYRSKMGEEIELETGEKKKVWRAKQQDFQEHIGGKGIGEAYGESAKESDSEGLSWKKTKEGEVVEGLSQKEMFGFEQKERKEDFSLEGEKLFDDEMSANIQSILAGPTPRPELKDLEVDKSHALARPLTEKDFDVEEYGLWAVASAGEKGSKQLGWGKHWNAIDPKTGKYEKITYFEGARRAAMKLAAGNKQYGTEAYDWAWGALMGFPTMKQGTTTQEGTVQFRQGMVQELRGRAQKHIQNRVAAGEKLIDAARDISTIRKENDNRMISGKAILSRNFLDQLRAHRREHARIQSVISGRDKGKRLSEAERKRRSKKQIAVAGGDSRNIQGGARSWRTGDDVATGDYSAWREDLEAREIGAPLAVPEDEGTMVTSAVSGEPTNLGYFDGEEFVEAEEGLEGADLTKLDLLIESMHSGSAEIANLGTKKQRALEATKIGVRKFLATFKKKLETENTVGVPSWKIEAAPWHSIDKLRHDIYVKVLIPEFANAKDWKLKSAKGLPRVEEQIQEFQEESFSIDKKLNDLNGKSLKQIISRLVKNRGKVWTSGAGGTILIDSYIEKFMESGILPENANVPIKVKMGGMGTSKGHFKNWAMKKGDKIVPLKLAGRRPKWAKGRHGWEKGNWVERISSEYIKELKVRKSIVDKTIWRLEVQRLKLVKSIERNPRPHSHNEVRGKIRKLVKDRNSKAAKWNEGREIIVDGKKIEARKEEQAPLEMLGEGQTKEWSTRGINSQYTNYKLSGGSKLSPAIFKQMEWAYKNAFEASYKEFQEIYSTRKDLRNAFEEVGLFTKKGKAKNYVDMFTENSLVANGHGRGNMTIEQAFDAATAPLKGEDRKRAKNIQPLIKKLLGGEHKPKVFLASIESERLGAAFYDALNDQIIIDPNKLKNDKETFEVLVEEFIHSITYDIDRLSPAASMKIDALRGKVMEEIENRGLDIDTYFLKDNQEFLAGAFYDQEVSNLLKSIKIKEGNVIVNVFKRIMDAVAEALGITEAEGTVLEEIAFHVSEAARAREAGVNWRERNAVIGHGMEGLGTVKLKQFAGQTAGIQLLYTDNIFIPEGSKFEVDKNSMVNPLVIVLDKKIMEKPKIKKMLNEIKAQFAAAALHGSPRVEITGSFTQKGREMDATPPAALAGAIKRRNIDWGSRRLGIDEGLFLPNSKPITRENVQELLDRIEANDNERSYGYGSLPEERLTRSEAEAVIRQLPDDVGTKELRRYLINDTGVTTKEEALREFEGLRRRRDEYISDLRLALSVVEAGGQPEQMTLFTKKGQGMLPERDKPRTGEEVLQLISSKTEVPAEAKTEVENAMTTWDKFKTALVSAAHPWDVLQRLVTKTPMQSSLAQLSELQAGSANMADNDVQLMEREIEGALGRDGRRLMDTDWSNFIIMERIKSRLLDQQTRLSQVEARLSQFQDKNNWTKNDQGELVEFDLRTDNTDFWVVDGVKKTKPELEMEYIRLLGISKEVAPYKTWEAFKGDYKRGIDSLISSVNNPELVRLDEFGNVAGKFIEAQEIYQDHMEKSLVRLVETGVLGPETYNKIQRSTSFYVPFYVIRYFNRNPEDTFGQTIKGITDIGETVVKPMDAGKFKIYYSRLRAERNLYLQKIELFRRDFDPEGAYINKTDDSSDVTQGSGKGTVMFYEAGRKRYLVLDRKVSDIANNFTPVSASQTHRVLKYAGDFFKLGATGANIFFQAFNFALFDPIRLLTTSKAGLRNRDKGLNPWVLGQQYARALFAASWANMTPNSIKNILSPKAPAFTEGLDNLYTEFVNSGAAGSTIAEYFNKPTHIKDALTGNESARRNPLTAFNAKISQLGKTLEQTTKMVGMQRMMGFEEVEKLKLKMDKAKTSAQKVAIKNQIDEKMDFIASEIRNYAGSPDFMRQGDLTKIEGLNVLFMFFNARIQGVERDLSRLSKVFSRDSQARGEAMLTAMKISSFAVLPTMLAWAMNRRDEEREDDYAEISDEDKKNYIHIPLGERFEHPYIEGKMVADYIRIPRRESFGLFSFTIEKALDWYYEKDPQAVSEIVGHWVEGIMPVNIAGATDLEGIKAGESVMSSLNPLIKTPVEILSNRNFYRHKPIVPVSLGRADVSEQYYDKTPQVYRDYHLGLGALRMEHLVNGMTAGMVTQFTPPRNTGIEGESHLGRTVASTPIIKRLARSTFLKESELDEILNDVNIGDATERVVRRRAVDKFFEQTRGMTLQERVRSMEPPVNNNHLLVNKAIVRRLREMALGLEPDEIRLKNASSNARAAVIIRKLQGKNPAEVKVYLTDLASKKILTQDVANYIREQLANRGETIQDYVTEPVR